VEVLTEKGSNLVNKYPALFENSPAIEKEKYLAKVEVFFDNEQIKEKLEKTFDHPTWMEQSLHCIGCGAFRFQIQMLGFLRFGAFYHTYIRTQPARSTKPALETTYLPQILLYAQTRKSVWLRGLRALLCCLPG